MKQFQFKFKIAKFILKTNAKNVFKITIMTNNKISAYEIWKIVLFIQVLLAKAVKKDTF